MCDRRSEAEAFDGLTAVRDTYDAVAGDYDAQFRDELSHKPLDRALLQALAECASGGTLADVGCGPGHVTAFLSQRHRDVLGLDLSPGMIDVARGRRRSQRLAVADMRFLPARAGAWAGIAALYSIIHLNEPQRGQAFAEFRRVLRKGGWLLLAFHVADPDHRPGDVNHLATWFGHHVDIDGHFLDPERVSDQLRAADLHVTAQLLRQPEREEYPSRRAYLLARASNDGADHLDTGDLSSAAAAFGCRRSSPTRR